MLKKKKGSDYKPILDTAKFLTIKTPKITTVIVPYFLGYKTHFFSFQNNPKDLDPSYKTDLDLRLFWKGKTCIIAKLHKTD